MPPWFADPHVGKFANDRSLADSDIETLAKWADTGAAKGNSEDTPAPVKFVSGWNIGAPDMILEMPKPYPVAAKGTIDYTYYVIPTGFKEDKWVDLRRSDPATAKVVHHVIAFVREPGSKWLREAVPGEPYVPKKEAKDSQGGAVRRPVSRRLRPGNGSGHPGAGQARLIKAGADIVLQMHYTANGSEQTDQTKVGIVFAKEPPRQRVVTLAAMNTKFVIPPGADDHKVESQDHPAGRYDDDRADPAHALAGQSVRIPSGLSDRGNTRAPARPQIRFFVAAHIYAC